MYMTTRNENQHLLVDKVWGYEILLENNNLYCAKHLHVKPNNWCSAHLHKNKKKLFYVINGELILKYSPNMDEDIWYLDLVETIILKHGESFKIDPYIVHRFSSNSNDMSCDFIEISTYHDDKDLYRIVPSVPY